MSSAATSKRPRTTARIAEAIVAALDAQLKKGDKALIGNSAYRRYLRKVGGRDQRSFEIDAGKLAEEARFDGIFVLRTNAKVTPLEAVLRYRDLLHVEDLFRRTKAIMRTRPIFHSSDAAIRGHVFCSFLALSMQKHLGNLAREAGLAPEWKDLLRELDRVQQVRIRHRGADWLVRTDAAPSITTLFRRAHVALPPRARQARPPPRRLEFRRNTNIINHLQNSGVQFGHDADLLLELGLENFRSARKNRLSVGDPKAWCCRDALGRGCSSTGWRR
jgi:hypothetical protein